jgi:parvulin-like peptidyl-prolyl isomerase
LASKGLDNIEIVYYKDEDDAEDAYDELEDKYEDFAEFADEYDIDIDDIDYGKSGNMVWYGTKDAVKAAR